MKKNEAPRALARGFLKRNTERLLFIRTLKGAILWPRMYKALLWLVFIAGAVLFFYYSMSRVAAPQEKTLGEVCLEHKCDMHNCAMRVRAYIRPGEKIKCPICGEVITAKNSKVIEVKPESKMASKKERKILYYRNPMNPEMTSPVAMKDAMGMDYVPVYEEAKGASQGLYIAPEKQKLMGIAVTGVKKINLTQTIRAVGKIAYDPELVITQEEFIQALKTEDNVKDSPLQDVIDRTKSVTEATRRKLKLLGMSDDQIAELEKTRKAQTNLYLPLKGEDVWAYIAVYEYEIGLIKVGLPVSVEAIAYPGQIFEGKIESISPILDPNTRTNQIRVKIKNPEDKLKPEMFVSATIKIDIGEKLAIPEDAVMDTGERKVAFILNPDGYFESREVVLGVKAQNYYEVILGLKEGNLVVSSGNFFVDSESRLKAVAPTEIHQHQQ